ncbi:hypothetical protein AB0M28_06770 [Streptomyces sp. NPDC051940]|uniref:hypothetical protein n=1 Tax=Streptomyces sp. NPDC051940 TaxID=3155675 RepID=UPI00342FA5B0
MSTPQGPQDPRLPNDNTYQIRPGVPQQPAQQPHVPPATAQSAQQYTSSAPTQPGQPYIQPVSPQPDWSAMAEDYEARSRRKKMLGIVFAIVAVVVIGAGAAVFTLTGKDDDKSGQATDKKESASAAPSPKASSPKASQSPALRGSDLFTATSLPADGQTLARKKTAHAMPCWKATQAGLGPLLAKCSNAVLATYSSAKASVTVAVLVFPSEADAKAVNDAFKGTVKPMPAEGGPAFCKQVECAVTHAVKGKYLYTTIAGPNNGKAGAKDANAIVAGHKVEAYTLSRLTELG